MSAQSRKRHTRKKRRQDNAVVRHGWSAKPTHRSRSGRTGSVHEKQLQSQRKSQEKGNAPPHPDVPQGEDES